jgi:hypothetical protein
MHLTRRFLSANSLTGSISSRCFQGQIFVGEIFKITKTVPTVRQAVIQHSSLYSRESGKPEKSKALHLSGGIHAEPFGP